MRKLLTLFIFLLLCSAVSAQTLYVTDSFEITFRTGQGTEHKIIGMLPSGEKIELLQTEEKWARIKRKNGAEGWVLKRFLTETKPSSVELKSINRKYENLLAKSKKNIEELRILREENRALKIDLNKIRGEYKGLDNNFEKLKKDSKNFLSLKKEHETSSEELKQKVKIAEELESKLMERNIKMFIAGAVIMLVGVLIGLSAKKKKRGLYY